MSIGKLCWRRKGNGHVELFYDYNSTKGATLADNSEATEVNNSAAARRMGGNSTVSASESGAKQRALRPPTSFKTKKPKKRPSFTG